MKRACIATLVALCMLGCSSNDLTIINRAAAQVTLELRAKEYLVLPNDTLKVPDDIPNGSYGYGSVIGVPGLVDDPYIVYEIGSGCSGTFNFLRSSTSILIVYGSTTSTVPDSAGHPITTYHVGATVSSSDPTGAIVGP